ncbi:MAG: hypothetical protein IPK06_18660 [Ignavibacteriae bacterium]|nr:hypothetical protein [Ignavibacteriota bacterium]
MTQLFVMIGFFSAAILIFAIGLHFSKYKKRENAGCCGGGHCSTDGGPHSCYASKSEFVDNYEKIKSGELKVK